MIRDDFAGPGGLDEGLRLLGIRDVIGVEHDRWACETAVAAGHRRVQADVTQMPSGPWAGIDGYVASPPCTSFSTAGKGEGTKVLAGIVTAAREVAAGGAVGAVRFEDPMTGLILEPLRVVRDLRPRWVALEQVPPCLPVWQEYARIFRSWGYCATARVLCAADFGVPQTRRRAILVARLDGPALLPEPTHAERPGDSLFGRLLPWVSMAEALGWGFTRGRVVVDRRTNSRGPGGTQVPTVGVSVDRPAPSFTGKSGAQWVVRGNNSVDGGPLAERGLDEPAMTVGSRAGLWVLHPGAVETPTVRSTDEPAPTLALGNDAASWAWERPATTIVGSFAPDVVAAPGYRQAGDGPRQDAPGSIRISPQQAAILQSFPPDYPFQGSKSAVFRQIGNAVPPVLACAIIGALLGLDWEAATPDRPNAIAATPSQRPTLTSPRTAAGIAVSATGSGTETGSATKVVSVRGRQVPPGSAPTPSGASPSGTPTRDCPHRPVTGPAGSSCDPSPPP